MVGPPFKTSLHQHCTSIHFFHYLPIKTKNNTNNNNNHEP